MNTWIVEHYSNDEDTWVESSRPRHLCLADAMTHMRSQIEFDLDIPHRVVHIETKRKTVALSAYGDELVK